MDIAQVAPDEQRDDCCLMFILLSSAAVGATMALLYVFASFVWGAAATAVVLAAVIWFMWRYFRAAVLLEEGKARDGSGLSEVDVEAIPAFQYSRKVGAEEQCAVCISVVRDEERLRRMPACGHAFHAPCIDTWLVAHATCPMCCAVVNVAGEKPKGAAA